MRSHHLMASRKGKSGSSDRFIFLGSCDCMDCSLPRPQSMGFSRQQYRSGLSCPPSADLPPKEVGTRVSCITGTTEPLGKLFWSDIQIISAHGKLRSNCRVGYSAKSSPSLYAVTISRLCPASEACRYTIRP